MSNAPTRLPLRIHQLLYKEADRSYRIDEHSQPCHQWYVCVHGTVATHIDGQALALSPGHSLLYHPGARRAPHCQGRAPGYLVLVFTNLGLDLDGVCDRVLELPHDLRGQLHTLIAELRQPQDSDSATYLTALATSLLIGQCRAARRARPALTLNAHAAAGKVARAERYMAAHLDEPLTRSRIAGAAGCSVPHLTRLLRGEGIQARLRTLRLERARRLLRDSDASIGDIALEVGFSSFSHFSRVFRTATGLSPSDYRRSGGASWPGRG